MIEKPQESVPLITWARLQFVHDFHLVPEQTIELPRRVFIDRAILGEADLHKACDELVDRCLPSLSRVMAPTLLRLAR